jgi:hypothetical protein
VVRRFLIRRLALTAAVCVCALTAAAGSARAAGGGAAVAPVGGTETWTLALYVNADNDLEYTWPRFTLPALKRIPASPHLNVVALVDKEAKTGSFLYQVSGAEVATVARFRTERNFGKGETFRWFLEQVHTRFPSDRLVVVGWDHGYGWRYFSHDYNADDRITMPELRAALAGAAVPIDILAFDACNMGDVEVAWDVASVDDPGDPGKPLVDFFVASEETIDQDGYPYDGMFAPLAADPGRSPEEVTDDLLRGWDGYYGSLRCFDWVSLSAVDLGAVREAGPAMADLAGRLRAGLAADPARYGGAMRGAVATSLAAWDSWQQDLGMFAERLVDGHNLDDDPGLVAAAAAVREAADDMVLGLTNGSYVRWLRGLSVWIGTGAVPPTAGSLCSARLRPRAAWTGTACSETTTRAAAPTPAGRSPRGRVPRTVSRTCTSPMHCTGGRLATTTSGTRAWSCAPATADGSGRPHGRRRAARTRRTRWRRPRAEPCGSPAARAGTAPSSRAARARAPPGRTPRRRPSSTCSGSRPSPTRSATPPARAEPSCARGTAP